MFSAQGAIKYRQNRAEIGDAAASQLLRSPIFAFRGKMAGVLLVVLYGNKELPKGRSRMDLNLPPDINVENAPSSNDLVTHNPCFLGHFSL